MRNRGIIVIALVAILSGYWLAQAGGPPTGPPPGPTMVTLGELSAKLDSLGSALPGGRYTFIGVSSGTTQGNAGWKGMSDLCAADYDPNTFPGVRMCLSVEIMATPPEAWPALADAWVHPTIAATVTTANSLLDISGRMTDIPARLSCAGWAVTDTNYTGIALKSNGGFSAYVCDETLAVACCAQ